MATESELNDMTDEVTPEKESEKPEMKKAVTQEKESDKSEGDATPDTKLKSDMGDTYSNWSSSSSEREQDGLIVPTQLCVGKIPGDATKAELMAFFEEKPVDIILVETRDNNNVVVELASLVTFASASDAKEALKLRVKLFRDEPLYITPQQNDCVMLCASGFNTQLSVELAKKKLRKKFKSYGTVLNIFLPQINSTSLGFAYIYLDLKKGMTRDSPELSERVKIGGDKVKVRTATPRQCFYAEMEGKTVLQESVDPKIALKKVHFPIQTNVVRNLPPFCWTDKREDIICAPYVQTENNCWSVAFSRAYNAWLSLTGSMNPKLTPDALAAFVDPVSTVSDRGISSLKCAVSAMEKLVGEINVYRRPRGDSIEKHEEFERLLIALLKKAPIMISMDLLPDYLDLDYFNGDGVYVPSKAEFYMRTYEKLPLHCLLLTGYGVENGVEYWKLQDSNGAEWGEKGFIKVACHKCLIKSAIELKV